MAGLLNSPAFLEVQITSAKTTYLEHLYFHSKHIRIIVILLILSRNIVFIAEALAGYNFIFTNKLKKGVKNEKFIH